MLTLLCDKKEVFKIKLDLIHSPGFIVAKLSRLAERMQY